MVYVPKESHSQTPNFQLSSVKDKSLKERVSLVEMFGILVFSWKQEYLWLEAT